MRETGFAAAIVIGLLLLALTMTLPADTVMLTGSNVMLTAGAIGLPLELVYFTLLGVTLMRRSVLPRGWYWRSFDHHHLLAQRERWLVLPWFYAGALAFVVCILGIVVAASGLIATLAQLGFQ